MQKHAEFLASAGRAPRSAYVLAGAEALLRDEAERAIERAAFGGQTPDVVRIDGLAANGEPVEPAVVFDEARGMSLFGGRKLVSVSRADAFVRAHAEALVGYLEDPDAEAILVLHVERWEKKRSIEKKLDRWAVDCGSPYEFGFEEQAITPKSPLFQWVRTRAKARKVALGPDAIVRLIELVGTGLADLGGAIETISLAARSEPGAVGPADVDRMIAPSRAYTQFRVAELAACGRTAEALAAADACFTQGLPGPKGSPSFGEGTVAARLIWAISREFERLYAARGIVEREGALGLSAAGKLGVPPFRAKALEAAARSMPLEDIERALELAFDAEFAVKRGEADARFAVEKLILGIGRAARPSAVPAR